MNLLAFSSRALRPSTLILVTTLAVGEGHAVLGQVPESGHDVVVAALTDAQERLPDIDLFVSDKPIEVDDRGHARSAEARHSASTLRELARIGITVGQPRWASEGRRCSKEECRVAQLSLSEPDINGDEAVVYVRVVHYHEPDRFGVDSFFALDKLVLRKTDDGTWTVSSRKTLAMS